MTTRKVLIASGMENNDAWLHINIFRTSTTSEGKVCKLIIDMTATTTL